MAPKKGRATNPPKSIPTPRFHFSVKKRFARLRAELEERRQTDGDLSSFICELMMDGYRYREANPNATGTVVTQLRPFQVVSQSQTHGMPQAPTQPDLDDATVDDKLDRL